MIKRSGDYRVEVIEHLKGGEGNVEVTNFFEMEDFLGKGRLYGKSVIEPGCGIGYHRHEGDQEAYYILKGQAAYKQGEESTILYPGDMAICRDGESHSITAIGEMNLEYVMLILYV